jgi:hypothetical protein
MMIIELQPHEFARVLPLYRAARVCFPLISAVIQNKQLGQIFVDDKKYPASAVVLANFGFMSFLGTEQNRPFNSGLAQALASKDVFRASYLLWYSPPAAWQRRLDAFNPAIARRRERVRFEFGKSPGVYGDESVPGTDEFALKNLSRDLIPKTEKFGVQIDSRFWSSAADFEENGLGVCILKDDEVICVCYAAAIVDGLAEVDVITQQEFRDQGLAYFAARQFIKECLSRGIIPTWDCFVDNPGSMKLADKLGFIQISSYPFYSFNVPIEVSGAIEQAH